MAGLVELQGVTQSYGTPPHVFTAIREVSLSFGEGQFVALLGPSGCGKSTIVRLLTGLQRPTQGKVLYREHALNGVNPHASIVFQTFALFPWLTVQQNVEVALKARGVPPKLRVLRAVDLLDRVGLDGFETAYPRELSGGMRQKAGFARAMAVEPELLCMDEPFSALDVLSAETLRLELLTLWTSGKIPTRLIVLVTHNIEEAVLMADRIVVMAKDPGHVVADLNVPLPRPRHRKSPTFQAFVDQVYSLLAGQTSDLLDSTSPGSLDAGPTRALPHVTVSALMGFIEHLAHTAGQSVDLYKLGEALGVDSDHVLQLAEAAEVLGFCLLAQGDISLTPLGETFADGGIQARKQIFAIRARRVPIVAWLLSLLTAADDRQMERDVTESALRLAFSRDEAERQLDIGIDWGRYAELISYDGAKGVIYLEHQPVLELPAGQT
jgi:NitT/TauT family transport system ATP-binding protein